MSEKDQLIIRKFENNKEAEICARMMVNTEPWITLKRNYESALNIIIDPSREVYIALVDGIVTGFTILVMNGAFVGYIQSICIDENYRNRGIGSALINHAEKRIFSDTPNVFICVSSFNEDAKRLYLRKGYEIIGELKDFIVAGHSEILLRKTISPLTEFKKNDKQKFLFRKEKMKMKFILPAIILFAIIGINSGEDRPNPFHQYIITGDVVCDSMHDKSNYTIRLYGKSDITGDEFVALQSNGYSNSPVAITDSSGHYVISLSSDVLFDSLKIGVIQPHTETIYSSVITVNTANRIAIEGSYETGKESGCSSCSSEPEYKTYVVRYEYYIENTHIKICD